MILILKRLFDNKIDLSINQVDIGVRVEMPSLIWKDICDNGLNDPFIMRIGLKNKKFRLEAGNHRIQVFYKNQRRH